MDPARLVFEGHEGEAIVVSLVDMGGRFRLICQDIHLRQTHLPHAQPAGGPGDVAASPRPDHRRGVLDHRRRRPPYGPQLRRYRRTDEGLGTDDGPLSFVHITEDTTLEKLEHDLFLSDLAWKLRGR